MAGCKIITYDLISTGKDYSGLISAIKKYSNLAKITESCWVIKSNDSAIEIRDNLISYIDSNDKLFVATLTGEGAWTRTIPETQWLKNNL